MLRIWPCVPLSNGKPRVDDQRVIGGNAYVGPQWLDVVGCRGKPRILQDIYNRFIRWSRMGVLAYILI
jgi:transposase